MSKTRESQNPPIMPGSSAEPLGDSGASKNYLSSHFPVERPTGPVYNFFVTILEPTNTFDLEIG